MRKILKSLNSSQLFSSPDFPENCKWTKRGKLGSCFDYQMTGTVQGLCPARLCPDHISPPWLQLLSRFALLCSTLNFAGPQRNWAFAFYICFVQMSVDFFPCGLGLIRACMHISSTDKKLPSCMLTALPANSCMMSFISHLMWASVRNWACSSIYQLYIIIRFLYVVASLWNSSVIQTCYQYYTTSTCSHKGRRTKI